MAVFFDDIRDRTLRGLSIMAILRDRHDGIRLFKQLRSLLFRKKG
ncbi:MAG: hypothetical protein WCP16_17320 [Pseudanabaena sp. ELA645]